MEQKRQRRGESALPRELGHPSSSAPGHWHSWFSVLWTQTRAYTTSSLVLWTWTELHHQFFWLFSLQMTDSETSLPLYANFYSLSLSLSIPFSLYLSLPPPSILPSYKHIPNNLQLTFRTHAQYTLLQKIKTQNRLQLIDSFWTPNSYVFSLSKCDQCIMPPWMLMLFNKIGMKTEPSGIPPKISIC